jgi:hypothetical protein
MHISTLLQARKNEFYQRRSNTSVSVLLLNTDEQCHYDRFHSNSMASRRSTGTSAITTLEGCVETNDWLGDKFLATLESSNLKLSSC